MAIWQGDQSLFEEIEIEEFYTSYTEWWESLTDCDKCPYFEKSCKVQNQENVTEFKGGFKTFPTTYQNYTGMNIILDDGG